MALELRQILSQKMIMTPQLRQAIKLLQLSKIELQDYISEQLNENPILEQESMDTDVPMEAQTTGESMISDQMAETGIENKEGERPEDKIDWEKFAENASSLPPSSGSASAQSLDDLPSIENTLTKKDSLQDHLLFQLNMSSLTEEEKGVGELIIGDLDDSGYFRFTLEEYSETNDIDPLLLEDVLDEIQHFDPIGVAARDLQECLLIQIKLYKMSNGIIENIVKNHMNHLETHNYNVIAKTLKVKVDEIIENVKLISELEPKPGRPFTGDDTTYITPDIYVFKDGNDWVVSLNEDGLPKLKVSNFYKNVLKTTSQSKQDKEYIQDKMKSAIWLIKSVQQRQRTIYKVMESILKFQKDFFEHGVNHLKPLVLRDVAEDISMHESTVSRVTTNKYVHSPRGILELKYFFNTSVSRDEGSDVAAETVKEFIRKVIAKEDPKKPLSDQTITAKLKAFGISLARRTVAKYREQMGILSSSKRKKYF